MKNYFKLAAFAFIMLGSAAASHAQSTASATSTATIVTPITITKTVDMNFGNVAVSASSPGTVVLDPAGSRTPSGGVTLPAVTGTVAAASFDVAGQANYTYTITLPAGTHTITSGVNSMNVDTFTSSPSTTGTLSASGTETLTVGATLNVSAGQASGTYVSGTPFDVTVNYN